MKVTNELRRLRAKLSIFHNDTNSPFYWLILDCMKKIDPNISDEKFIQIVSEVQKEYKKRISELTKENSKQQKLFK